MNFTLIWDVRQSCYFEPTFTFMGFLYCPADVRPPLMAGEGRNLVAVTHLAGARRQTAGNGTPEILNQKIRSSLSAASCHSNVE